MTDTGSWGGCHMIGYEGLKWVAYFWFNGFQNIQLGLHFDISRPNMEIHVPFGFFRVGRK